MLEKYLQIETLSIVYLGNFNPVILQPFWLSGKKLIREEEAENAKISIIHNEIVKFDLDWVGIEITKSRCVFMTAKEPYFNPVKDLAIGIFKILNETPIKSLGINHIFDLSLPNQEKYYDFGNKLSPLNIWKDKLNDPRLLKLEILEKERKDKLNGQYTVRIAPSNQKISFGISININDHFEIIKSEKGTKLEMVNRLEKSWENSFIRAKEVIKELLSKLNL